VPQRLDYYLEQAKFALAEAGCARGEDRASWMRIAAEWQRLHDVLSRDLGVGSEEPREQRKAHK
jgi:hypothetical protein